MKLILVGQCECFGYVNNFVYKRIFKIDNINMLSEKSLNGREKKTGGTMVKSSEFIYHGSYMEIEFPGIRKHRVTKDFSWGFYCTKIKDQAERWAEKFNTPIVSVYEVKDMESLNIKNFEDYTDEWLEFVVKCRSGSTHEYDVVIGPMADDTIYDYIEAYTHGQMNKKKFFELMKFKYPTHQVSFHTIKALDCINFRESYRI